MQTGDKMCKGIVSKDISIKDLLLCLLPILAFISMQYRFNDLLRRGYYGF